MMTRDNICYNLKVSPYKFTILNITYFFTSEMHLQKFKDKIKENRKIINISLTKRFNINITFNVLSDVMLYKKIETRGFLLMIENEYVECLELLKLDGEKLMKKN